VLAPHDGNVPSDGQDAGAPRGGSGVMFLGWSCTIPLTSGDASTASSRVSTAATTTANCWHAARVIHDLDEEDDVQASRAEISRHARADRIKVRTGFNDGIV
jgi:hypothetical protein